MRPSTPQLNRTSPGGPFLHDAFRSIQAPRRGGGTGDVVGQQLVLRREDTEGALLSVLKGLEIQKTLGSEPVLTALRHFPAQAARLADFPPDLHPKLREVLEARGYAGLYAHQREAYDAVQAGGHTVVVTPTASGKTLCYNLPVLDRILKDPDARALYLFPTKALSQDQLAELYAMIQALGADIGTFTYDGDTPQDARKAIRARAHVVVTNPDMLHKGILPHHTKWGKLFENLRYVVVDELHSYRGVYGSHLANVLRRLGRLCRESFRLRRLGGLVGEDLLGEVDLRAERLGALGEGLRLLAFFDPLQRQREPAPIGVDLDNLHVHEIAL